MTPWIVAVAWGVVLAIPFVLRARRRRIAERASWLRLEPTAAPSKPASRVAGMVARLPLGAPGRIMRAAMTRARRRRGDAAVAAELPVAIDLLAVAVGAGCTPYLAVEVAARWAPPAVASHFRSVPRACSLGASFGQALDDLASVTPRLAPLADALLASDRLGAPVGPALGRLADEERASLRRQAEAEARTVPVRLLFPLVFLVLPAFGLLTVVPTLVGGLTRQ